MRPDRFRRSDPISELRCRLDRPTLFFADHTYERRREDGVARERVVEGILNGLSPDPRAFVGKSPDSLASYEEESTRFRVLFEKHRGALLTELEHCQPTEDRYTPVAFYFNFLHNTLKAVVVDALFRGEASTVTLDDLLTGFPEGGTAEASETMARTLMSYARSSPDRIRGQWVPAIVYDPRKGRRAYTDAMRRLRPKTDEL